MSGQAIERWLKQIGIFIADGRTKCYAEDALNQITSEVELEPLYYSEEFCMEVDDAEDLAAAKNWYRNGLK